MTQPTVTPPCFAGLVWTDLQALATDSFWSLYRYRASEGKMTLALAGITAKKVDGTWSVHFNPATAGDKAADIVSGLELTAFAIRPTSQHQLDADRIRAEEQSKVREAKDLKHSSARRRLTARFGDLTDADLIAAAQAAGRAIWQHWNSFCVNKKKLAAFSAIDARISLTQASWLLDLVDQTTAKAEAVRENLVAADNAVDWPDDDVVRAVETLTWADSDQASTENGEGWSKADSSRGHWCMGMIKRGGSDWDIGIDAARAIVGKYAKQLAKGEAA